MTTLATHMIRHNDRADVAILDIDNTPAKIRAKTVNNFSCDVLITLKVKNEKEITLTRVPDNMTLSTLRDLLDEYVDTDFVTYWMPAFTYEPHVEAVR